MAEPTQVEKMAAAWARLRIMTNTTLPNRAGQLRKIFQAINPPHR